jgi:hypothetical protein
MANLFISHHYAILRHRYAQDTTWSPAAVGDVFINELSAYLETELGKVPA